MSILDSTVRDIVYQNHPENRIVTATTWWSKRAPDRPWMC